MIKYLETLIKLIIALALLSFFYHFIKDLSFYVKKTNEYNNKISAIQNKNNTLSANIKSSKDFYEENQKIIEATRISDEELNAINNAIFKNITDKKLGFFTLKDTSFKRNTKIINVYSIKGTLNLIIDSLFTLEDTKLLINNEINKTINEINELNKGKIEIIPIGIYLDNKDYYYEFNIFKKITKREEN